ncbi:P-loop containing nucleoside triphosphate hydrolase protein [Talaromyces proteolyticus]|uniref:P-loop containing nucleoside triphosphate hydrolase protein n=1 Tax=Talaromyces proteolyticus TaxID=1131652 RepID=A0AAD4Q3V4_9EURO|nr:P-loop containing nucleoside triphosphate hydrolase protein [Talaromyces proteolyticus]KAH8705474.1 P-loop containing nucleoside triphosphate hydrolase protein [Talaromyces proteolyticus]
MVTTYELLISDGHRLNRMGVWKAVVLDEGHRIKDATRQNALSVSRLKTEQRIILTGTPIQNDLLETWSMLRWLYPEVFGHQDTSSAFKRAFALSEGKVDLEFLQDLGKFLKVAMLRRTKETASLKLDLPPKTEITLYAPLTSLQRRLYLEIINGVNGDFLRPRPKMESAHLTSPRRWQNSFHKGMEGLSPGWSETSDQRKLSRAPNRSILNPLMELRKVCTHPLALNRFDDDEETGFDIVATSSKFIIVEKLLDRVVIKERKKVLIFSGFDQVLDCCEALLEELDIEFLRLDGKTCSAMRKLSIHLFNNKPDHRVFLVATRAGGEGVTLTSAEVVIFLDLDWNPQVIHQAEARAHRIGQTKPVTVYKLCTRGTVEEQMMSRLNKKLYLEAIVNGDFANSTNTFQNMAEEQLHTDTTFIRNLVRSSLHTFAVDKTDGEEMMHWDWERIVDYCRAPHQNIDQPDMIAPPDSPMSHDEDETNWLTKNERIRTDELDGMKVPRSPKKSKLEFYEAPASPVRKIIPRAIFNKEYDCFVSKESTLCEPGEAVPPMITRNSSSADSKEPTRWRNHIKTCLFCGKQRGLTECAHCPNSFHEKCLGKKKSHAVNNFRNICAYHKCSACFQSAADAGGMLFLCNSCPRAFCVDCVNLDTMVLICDEIPKFKALGYQQPKSAMNITCGDCASQQSSRFKRGASQEGLRRINKRFRV